MIQRFLATKPECSFMFVTLCQKHEVLSPVCGKPQVLVSSRIFFGPKTDVSFGFEADDVVASGLKEEINLLAANFQKFPPGCPPCCLLRFSQHAGTFDISADQNIWLQSALRSFAIVCDYMETVLFAIVCDRLRSYGNQP